MNHISNNDLIKDLLRLQLVEERHVHEYFLTSLGSTVSRFVRNRLYHYLVLHLKPGAIFEGSKWNEARGLVDTGRLARQEIFSCVRKGILPAGKYSSRTSQKRNRYGGEERIICVSMRLPDVPHDLTHLNDIVCTLEGILWQSARRREGACSEISFSICFLAD